MTTETLFTAFAIEQARFSSAVPLQTRCEPDLSDDTTLLNALRHSATDRDQIIQRRIGMIADGTNPT